LIALEHENSLEEFANKAVRVDAIFSSELLESIFAATTPLHDGAVIIRDKSIVAASVILPLAEDSSQLAKSMGTRHRAGLGLSQLTDAVVIVISEESGKVSIAREGVMTRGIKADRFKGILRSIFTSAHTGEYPRTFNILRWLKE
jgi:DNA integrity scanning protein DisA with diadenylate cyclase activity